MAGAIHWTDPWTVRDPGALVSEYFKLFQRLGGIFVQGTADGLVEDGAGWATTVDGVRHTGKQAVVALGPWAPEVLDKLGYRLPLFVKRGYHMHYGTEGNAMLNRLVLDEIGRAHV